MPDNRLGLELSIATLLTLGNLLSGFFAIVAIAGNGLFGGGAGEACRWVLLAMTLDGLDGWVARRYARETHFGKLLDNLADMTSFGVAPALLAANSFGPPLGLALSGAILYLGCVALRLARFASETPDRLAARGFSGLPCPAGALTMLGMVLAGISGPMPVIMCGMLGGLMVSRMPCPHPAVLGRWLLVALAALVALLIVRDLQHAVLAATLAYLAWSLVYATWRR